MFSLTDYNTLMTELSALKTAVADIPATAVFEALASSTQASYDTLNTQT